VAKVAVPIVWLSWQSESAFPNEVHEVFQDEGAWNAVEDFTFTGRVSIDPKDPQANAKKLRIMEKLERILDPGEAKRMFQLLDDHDWDVSFFVDTW
jgi:hypothetical protein